MEENDNVLLRFVANFRPEDEDGMFLPKGGIYLRVYMEPKPKGTTSSF